MRTKEDQKVFAAEGLRLWKLGAIYWDGRNYRWTRIWSKRRRLCDAGEGLGQAGRIVLLVNAALKRTYGDSSKVHEAAQAQTQAAGQ